MFKYIYLKNICDIFVAIILFILLLPIFIIISLLIKSDSNGPILYISKRSGLNAKPFIIFKFRTMKVGSHKGPSTTSKNDLRVTKIGRFLRKTKFDEFPQLINIILGQMSFIGPRPELLKYTNLYNSKESIILSVKPGLSDFSSLKYFSLNKLINNENPDEYFEKNILENKNQLRINYAEKISFIVDFKILIKTIFKVINSIFKYDK
tara:strand:- start:997 stop:1617 length:621 start_codon:yes stop_codon:yes gene_type:complete